MTTPHDGPARKAFDAHCRLAGLYPLGGPDAFTHADTVDAWLVWQAAWQAALTHAAQHQTPSDGWVVQSAKLAEVDAALHSLQADGTLERSDIADLLHGYRRMLSAAPSAPSQTTERSEERRDDAEAAQLWGVLLQVAADAGYRHVSDGTSEFDFLQDLVRRGALSMRRT